MKDDPKAVYQLKPISVRRYWQAHEPVVLLSGPDIKTPVVKKPKPRPECHVIELTDRAPYQQITALADALEEAAPKHRNQSTHEWTSMLMESGAELWSTMKDRAQGL